jgi:hypothetical protein
MFAKMNRQAVLPPTVLDWLLAADNPSVRYRTLRDLLGVAPDVECVRDARSGIAGSRPVQKIFAKMHADGFWLFRGVGDGVDYAMSSSTHFMLAYLAELGLDRSDERVARAAERYLNLTEEELQAKGGYSRVPDFQTHQSCLYAYNIRTFVMLGYRDDPRLQPRIATLLADEQSDNGYLCRRPAFNDQTKSCIRGSTKALMAFAALPAYWDHPRCQALVDYFLRRRIFYRSGGSTEVIRRELVSTIFPFVISGSLLEPLYALSRMGYANHPALEPAWQALLEKTDAEGRVCLDWHPPSPFVPGKKGEANKWTTLYAAMALRGTI